MRIGLVLEARVRFLLESFHRFSRYHAIQRIRAEFPTTTSDVHQRNDIRFDDLPGVTPPKMFQRNWLRVPRATT
jgi:hypothetical protein